MNLYSENPNPNTISMTAISGPLGVPDDLNAKIWRYMKLDRFEYLLRENSLYFARADMFDDPFEGSLTETASSGFLFGIDILGTYEDGTSAMLSQVISNIAESMRSRTYVNCWHMNEVESDAMWRLYGPQGKSIAIQSTYSRLSNCLLDKIYLGMVEYIDYEKDRFPNNSWLLPFYHKRKEFDHEREVRAVLVKHGENLTTRKPKKPVGNIGIPICVDLNKLVEAITIAPSSSPDFLAYVKRMVKKYGYDFKVKTSGMDKKPVF